MKPAPFTYHAPADLGQTLALLAELGPDAKVLAGGQSLVPVLNMRLAGPAHLVDINKVAGLDGVVTETDAVRVGAEIFHNGRPVGVLPLEVEGDVLTLRLAYTPDFTSVADDDTGRTITLGFPSAGQLTRFVSGYHDHLLGDLPVALVPGLVEVATDDRLVLLSGH